MGDLTSQWMNGGSNACMYSIALAACVRAMRAMRTRCARRRRARGRTHTVCLRLALPSAECVLCARTRAG